MDLFENIIVEFRRCFFNRTRFLRAFPSRSTTGGGGKERGSSSFRGVSSAVIVVWRADDNIPRPCPGKGRGESTAKAGLGKDAVGEPHGTHKTTAAGRDCYLNKYGGGLTKAERKGPPPYKGT